MDNLEFDLPELDPRELDIAMKVAEKDIKEEDGVSRKRNTKQSNKETFGIDEGITKLGKKISK